MAGYIYLAVISAVLAYTILKDILMYKKGKYFPNINKQRKGMSQFVFTLAISLFICFGGAIFGKDLKILHLMLYILIIYSICTVIITSALNYLCYRRSGERKIILRTILYDVFIILVNAMVLRAFIYR